MSLGERAALEGVLSQVRPRLALEIGTAEGGSLARIAAHSEEVHSIDLVRCPAPQPDHVTLHVGDSRERCRPYWGASPPRAGRSTSRSSTATTPAPGCARTSSTCSARPRSPHGDRPHDTFNGEVRAGITDVDFASYPDVALVELDMTGGYMARSGPFAGQLWGGIGLVIVDAEAERREGLYNQYLHDAWAMIRELGGEPPRKTAAGDPGAGGGAAPANEESGA